MASYTRTVSPEGEVLTDETLLDPELANLVASLGGAERLPDGRATSTQSGAWSDGLNEHRFDLIEIIEPSNEPLGERPEPPFPVEAHPVVAQPDGLRYSPEIDQLPPDEAIEVHLQLRQRPQTRLHWRRAAALASFTGGHDANAHKRAVLAARRAEIAELQTEVKALALSLGPSARSRKTLPTRTCDRRAT